jgi:hypothetical protein
VHGVFTLDKEEKGVRSQHVVSADFYILQAFNMLLGICLIMYDIDFNSANILLDFVNYDLIMPLTLTFY